MKSYLAKYLIIISLTLTVNVCYGKTTKQVSVIDNPTLVNTAQTLPNSGILKVADGHYIYLQVSNDFIKKLFPILMQNLTPKERSCTNPDNNSLGAHMTLFDNGILNQQQIKTLPVGQSFNFQVTQIEKIRIIKNNRKHKKITTIWYVVDSKSPALNTILQQFPQKNSPQKLHISIAQAKYHSDGTCILPH